MRIIIKTILLLSLTIIISCSNKDSIWNENLESNPELANYIRIDDSVKKKVEKTTKSKILFNNGSIEYKDIENDKYINGIFKVDLNDFNYKFYFSVLEIKKKANFEIYDFITSATTEVIEDSLILLPGSLVSVFTRNNKILSVNIPDGRFITNNSNIVFKNRMSIMDSKYDLSDSVSLELGMFNIPLLNIKFQELFGDIKYPITYEFEKNYHLDNNWLIVSVNLNPSIYLYGKLMIDRMLITGDGKINITLFEEAFQFENFNLPKILTKGNPLSIEGHLEYNYLTKYFYIYTEKSFKSGNLSVNGRKSLRAILDPNRFGVKFILSGKINYQLDSLKLWLSQEGGDIGNVLEKKVNLPLEDWLIIKSLQQFNVDLSVILNQESLNLYGNLGFNSFYNPDELDKPKMYANCDVFTPIIELEYPNFKKK